LQEAENSPLKNSRQFHAPLFEALKRYAEEDKVPFHTPGHKQGKGIHRLFKEFIGQNLFKIDLTVLEETDCLFHPTGILREAQDLAAEAFGADKTYFLLNGSSGGNHAMLLTVCNPGDRVIVGRNAHKSILGGMILTGIIPIYVMPEVSEELGLIKNVTTAAIEATLKENPNAKAVMVVSPTYYGISADLKAIAEISHRYGKILLVDGAHGPHFHFHPDLPIAAVDAGADCSVESIHKILSGMTQASMLHVKGNRVDIRDLESVLFVIQSTSPSYILMASLDVARMQMATEGDKLLGRAIELSQQAREGINKIDGLYSFGRREIRPFDLDLTKVTVNLKGLSLNGYEASQILNHEYNIQPEMADLEKLLFLITIADGEEDIQRLIKAFQKLAHQYRVIKNVTLRPRFPELSFQMAMSPREAFFAKQKTVTFKEAIGEVSTELFTIYPPGLPVIVPGEIITEEAYAYLREMAALGAIIDGPADRQMEYIRIVEN